jgi:hypothetical protein
MDGQWQMITTWDRTAKQYLDKDKIMPEPIPYYSYAIITRLTAKYSTVHKSERSSEDVAVTALRSPDGNLTLIAINNSTTDQPVQAELFGLSRPTTFYCYQVTESAVTKPNFQMNPLKDIQLSGKEAQFTDNLPKSSITVYSTYHLAHADNGISEVTPH